MTAINGVTVTSPDFIGTARFIQIRDAAAKARRTFPGVVGEVLADEVKALENLSWLGEDSRPARLLRAIQAMDEEGDAR